MTYYENASMDGFTKVLTALFSLGILVAFGFWVFSSNEDLRTTGLTLGLILILALAVAYLFIPRLGKAQGHIKIRTKLNAIEIPLNQVKEIALRSKTRFHFRTLGIGGLFGYFGYFNGKEIWYVTNLHKAVRIELNSGKVYVVSPRNPLSFIEDVQNDIKN